MKKLIVFIFSVFVILVVGKPFLKGGRGSSSFFGGFAGGATGSIVGSALTSKSSRGSSSSNGVTYRDLRDLDDWCRKQINDLNDSFNDMIRALDELERRVVRIEEKLNIMDDDQEEKKKKKSKKRRKRFRDR